MNHEIPANLKEEFDHSAPTASEFWALAYRDLEPKGLPQKRREGPDLRGYVAFLDPAQGHARAAIAALQADGISVKVLTGDNEVW